LISLSLFLTAIRHGADPSRPSYDAGVKPLAGQEDGAARGLQRLGPAVKKFMLAQVDRDDLGVVRAPVEDAKVPRSTTCRSMWSPPPS